jgi:hypothetical protein
MREDPRSTRGSRGQLGEEREERGSALVMAIFVLVLLTGMGTTLLFLSQNEMMMNQANVRAKQAFYLAEAGLEQARTRLWQINGNDPFLDDLQFAAGPDLTDEIDFDLANLVVQRDADGNVTGFTGYGNDRPLVPFTTFSDGAYIAFLTNDPIEGRAIKDPEDNDRVLLTAIGAGSDNSLESIEAIIEYGVLLPGVPPATITLLGPKPHFESGTSKVKLYEGEDCGGTGIYVPIVGTLGEDQTLAAEQGIEENPTFQSGSYDDEGTFEDLTDDSEPLVSGSYGAIDEDAWADCENWHQIIESLRLMADVVCADGTELYNTCMPPPDAPQRIVFGDGDLLIPPGNHSGTLVVVGQLRLNGNASWEGLILAVGEGDYLINGAGNGVVSGGVIVADIAGPDEIYGTDDDCTGGGSDPPHEGFGQVDFVENGGGNAGTVYCSTAIAAALPAPPYEIREFLQH